MPTATQLRTIERDHRNDLQMQDRAKILAAAVYLDHGCPEEAAELLEYGDIPDVLAKSGFIRI